ncbi:MAG: response regulator [Xanthobacteraceae bacterium]|nr:response regulator [Xanthobacteraceae bacterium]
MGEAALPEVLVVEDEYLICLMIKGALREAGFSVHTFNNGRDALGYLTAGGHADVLFTDIDLGGDIDGVELARRSRALDSDIGVIYASGRTKPNDTVPGSAFLPKPFILAQACATVERIAGHRKAA